MKTTLLLTPFIFLFFSINLQAQNPSIKWWYNTNDAAFGMAASDDIDNDGKLEVVFGCYRNDSSVYALNAENGTLLWKYNTAPAGFEGCNDVAPVIYDVDGNNQLEVIVPSSCNPKTFCFNGVTGTTKWIANTRGSDSPPTIADIDNDGKPEILHGEFGGYVICMNAEDGTIAWEIPVDTNSWIQTAPTVLDLNNDTTLDFVVGTWDFNNFDSVVAFRGDNQQRLWSFALNDHLYHGTAVADFDMDGNPELVFGSYNDTIYCLNGEDGTLDWKYYGQGGYCGAPVSLGDVDNDGFCDVVFASGSRITALSGTGSFMWTYTIPAPGGAFRGTVLADINNDQFLDVIIGSDGGKLVALNGNNGTHMWTIDLRAHYGNSQFELSHAPLVADFDGDDTLDIFIAGGHAEYPTFSNDFGRAYMISTGSLGNGPDWLMFQRDVKRQSSHCAPFLTSDDQLTVGAERKWTIYPNPASSRLNIDGIASPYHLTIYNALGQVLYQKNNLTDDYIDISRFPEGLLMIAIEFEDQIFHAKVMKE